MVPRARKSPSRAPGRPQGPAARVGGGRDRLRRFEQEARAASALNHPNIVTIFDIGRDEGMAYYVMELVSGGSLREWLRGGPLPLETALDVAAQIADGLGKAHDAGIIHRDLKPENVLRSDDGLVKIVDFGIAKLLSRPDRPLAATTAPGVTTAAGLILGTVGYMSPEQASGADIGVRSDMFSLDTMLYEMLAGHPPFARATPVQTMSAMIEFDPGPLSDCVSEVPVELSDLVHRLLCKVPEGRPEARSLVHELRGLRPRMPRRRNPRSRCPHAPLQWTPIRRYITIIEAELANYGALVDSIGSDAADDVHAQIERAFDASVTARRRRPADAGRAFRCAFRVACDGRGRCNPGDASGL